MAFQLRAILVAKVFTADVLKGIVGLVLLTVNLALLCNTLDIFAEMVLGLAPSLPTNLWLSFDNPSPLQFLRDFGFYTPVLLFFCTRSLCFHHPGRRVRRTSPIISQE